MNRSLKFLVALFSMVLILSACTGYSNSQKKAFDEKLQVFMKKENLQLTKTSSGVYYKIVTKGKGSIIKYNDKIRVMYTGKNMDVTVFDEKTTPIEFNLKNLLPAWKEILIGQPAGSIFYIATPPQMGYGSQQAGNLPPNSCLFFEIKVMSTL